MTLVELLAALAIAAAVASAALAVTVGLARAESAARSRERDAGGRDALRRVLRMDLVHARQVQATEQGFELRTLASLDDSGELVHLPTTVAYEVREVGEASWLVRTQHSDAAKNRTDLLACGVERIELHTGKVVRREAGGQWRPMPEDGRVTVVVTRAGRGGELVDFTLR